MAYSTPRTWTAGEVPTAAQFNQDIRDNVSFLANPPACRVYHSANQSIADNTATVLAFNSERYDTAAMHDTVTNNSRVTIPAGAGGLYVVTANVQFASAGDYAYAQAGIILNGSASIALHRIPGHATAQLIIITVSTVYKLAAGDYVEVQVRHDNTANAARNIEAATQYSHEFAAVWVGLG